MIQTYKSTKTRQTHRINEKNMEIIILILILSPLRLRRFVFNTNEKMLMTNWINDSTKAKVSRLASQQFLTEILSSRSKKVSPTGLDNKMIHRLKMINIHRLILKRLMVLTMMSGPFRSSVLGYPSSEVWLRCVFSDILITPNKDFTHLISKGTAAINGRGYCLTAKASVQQ